MDAIRYLVLIYSLIIFLLVFVASRGIPTRGQGVMHVGIFVGISLAFRFSEIGLEMGLGPPEQVDGLCGFVWGCHTHKED